jgi:hypothetical protein
MKGGTYRSSNCLVNSWVGYGTVNDFFFISAMLTDFDSFRKTTRNRYAATAFGA